LTTEIAQGEPIQVGGHEFTPLVRVTNMSRRRAYVGSNAVEGQGWGFVHMRPVAVLRRGEGDEQCLRIRDETARSIRRRLLAAVLVWCLGAILVRLARRSRDRLS